MTAVTKQQRRILMALDVAEFRQTVPELADVDDETLLVAMHQARTVRGTVSNEERRASILWLSNWNLNAARRLMGAS